MFHILSTHDSTNSDISITDPWTRSVSYHFFNDTTRDNFFKNTSAHGAGYLWSDLKNVPSFRAHKFPLPIIMVASQQANSTAALTFANSTVYEVS